MGNISSHCESIIRIQEGMCFRKEVVMITDELFNSIIIKLKNGEQISREMSEVLLMIKTDENVAQAFLLEFLNKIIESGNYNVQIMKIISDFLSNRIDIKTLSYKLFNEGKTGYGLNDDLYDKSLILHDNYKRGLRCYIYPYSKAQFYHYKDTESIIEKMLRVLFEFTRVDEPYLRGVCFDYCMFLCALDIIKRNRTDFIIECGITLSGEIHWFIVKNNSEVLDSFNGIYTDLNRYKIKGVISEIIPVGRNLTAPDNDQAFDGNIGKIQFHV